MNAEIRPDFLERLKGAYYLWFTSVRADGMPQPTPVWFVYLDGTFLIFSQPETQKIRNVRHNPRVALAYAGDPQADEYLVVMGEARIEDSPVPLHKVQQYLDKYVDGIGALGYTPEQMANAFNVAIRITPLRVRGE